MQKPGGIIALLDEAWYDMVFEPNKDFFLFCFCFLLKCRVVCFDKFCMYCYVNLTPQ
jgi:hypothetical protein